MLAMSRLMATAIHKGEYSIDRVPTRLKNQVEEYLKELEGIRND